MSNTREAVQLDRIKNNIDAAYIALEALGVDVPEGATVDELAALINDAAAAHLDDVTAKRIVQTAGTAADKVMSQKAVTEEFAKRGQLAPEYAESVEWLTENGDQNKMYVLPDGMIYVWMLTQKEADGGAGYTNRLPSAVDTDLETIYGGDYNGDGVADGYQTSTRLSGSSGATSSSIEDMCASGIIRPVKDGDVVRIKGARGVNSVQAYIITYNGATKVVNKNIAQETDLSWTAMGLDYYSVEDGTLVIPLTAANFGAFDGFRFSAHMDGNTIVTVNEEIKEGGGTIIVEEFAWASTGLAFVPADYEPRIIALEEQVAENKTDIANLKKGAVSSVAITKWDAPIYDAHIPVFELSAEKSAMTNAAMTPADIYARYDALMARHPHYITKTDLGLCSDGVNHVYRYDFCEPDSRHTNGLEWSETKVKAILVSGIHFEWAGIYGLYYALEEIAENPSLFDLRRNTHLIAIPCANPYATISSNYSHSDGVKNANGVEIHRNFEVGWTLTDAGAVHYGGAAPLTEVETQYIDRVLQTNADAALLLTCHSFGDEGFNFVWPSAATPYMCNMGYRLIDKLSNAWLAKHGDALVGLDDYRTDDIPTWDNRLGFAHISNTPGTETRQAAKYGIQGANVEINGCFWTHGTKANPEPAMSAFTMSRGTEVYTNFLLTALGVYDRKDKVLYSRV